MTNRKKPINENYIKFPIKEPSRSSVTGHLGDVGLQSIISGPDISPNFLDQSIQKNQFPNKVRDHSNGLEESSKKL